IVITAKTIYGAGLTVSYHNIQVVEVDALEGDDTIDVLSTAAGVVTRVIGGLGSDTINVAGDVVGDVVSRDITGTSGLVTHRLSSADAAYDGLLAMGVDLSVARPGQGQVVIKETGGFVALYEGGCFSQTPTPAACGSVPPVPALGSYTVALAAAPTANVYVTVSGANATQERQAAGGDNFLVSKIAASPSDFDRVITQNGVPVTVPKHAQVLVFTPLNWSTPQTVYAFAVDDSVAEGKITVTANHSVLSRDPAFDGALVRNVELTLHDNDSPDVLVVALDPSTLHPDDVTTVLEGSQPTPAVTEQTDLYAVQLAAP